MTLLFHVDESIDDVHHFHAGVLSTGQGAAAAQAQLEEVVRAAFDQGACPWGAELHGYDLHSLAGEWERATPDQAIAVLEGALAVLSSCSLEVIARGAHLPTFEERYGKGSSPFRWEFSNLLERLNERLEARSEFGLVIADEQHQYRELLQLDVEQARQSGTGGYRSQRLLQIVDTAHFVDSKRSRLTQLADLVAFVLRRRATHRTENDPRAEAAMQKLSSVVYTAIPNPTGQYLTIRR